MKTSTSIAKITRPKLTGIAPRERLFAQLDALLSCPVLWITAPGGSGKTTLAGSYLDARELPSLWYHLDRGDGDLAGFFHYLGLAAKKAAPRFKKPLPHLTPEYLLGIPVFARRFFETLFQRLPHNAVILFDDYQEVPDNTGFHDMFAHAMTSIPEGMRVIVLSRTSPPPQMARLQANRKLAELGWDDIRFTPEESVELLTEHGHTIPSDAVLKELYQRTSGWAAGLVLLTAQADLSEPVTDTPVNLTSREVFAYFASEIFERSTAEMRDLLLKTAFQEKVEPAIAVQLTGNNAAGEILEKLHRNHYFTQRYEQGYQYHPLFREFLLARATSLLPAEELARLRRETARLLENSGRFEEAVGLYADAAEWPDVTRLVMTHAQTLLIQGRNKTVEQWIHSVPVEQRTHNPWLIFWQGSCRLHFSPATATPLFEQAYELFRASGDMIGCLLSCSLIIDSIDYQWDDFTPMNTWVPILQALLDDHDGAFPDDILTKATISLFSAILFCQPFRPDVDQRLEQTLERIRKTGNPTIKMYGYDTLAKYFLWYGDIDKLGLISHEIDHLRGVADQPPFIQMSSLFVQGFIAMYATTDMVTVLELFEKGTQIGTASGIHVLDFMLHSTQTYAALSACQTGLAREMLDKLAGTLRPDTCIGHMQFHYLTAWLMIQEGDPDKAATHGEMALQLVEGNGYYFSIILCRLEMVWIETVRGNYTQAGQHLARAEQMTESTRNRLFMFSYHAAAAFLAYRAGDSPEGDEHLKQVVTLGRIHNFYILVWWWYPEAMSYLCARALEMDIEVKYVRETISRHRLAPPVGQPISGNWPWPVKLYTMGRFEIYLDGKIIDLAGKKKPLELLKLLLAFGKTPVSQAQATDLLWPEAEGDDGYSSFRMTLSRLRKMLPEHAVLVNDGQISLNQTLIWSDDRVLEQLAKQALALWKQPGEPDGEISQQRTEQAQSLCIQAFSLYNGAFLATDQALTWSVTRRERLRIRMQQLALTAGKFYEDNENWLSAIEMYHQGCDADPLEEAFCQRLMFCHQQLGNRSAGLTAYERCRAELAVHLGISPSTVTEALRKSLLG